MSFDPTVAAGLFMVTTGAMSLILKFTTGYAMFNPVWPPVVVVLVGVFLLGTNLFASKDSTGRGGGLL